jgi:hypothetical protein
VGVVDVMRFVMNVTIEVTQMGMVLMHPRGSHGLQACAEESETARTTTANAIFRYMTFPHLCCLDHFIWIYF